MVVNCWSPHLCVEVTKIDSIGSLPVSSMICGSDFPNQPIVLPFTKQYDE